MRLLQSKTGTVNGVSFVSVSCHEEFLVLIFVFFNADNAVVAADLTAWLNSLPKLLNQQVGSATYPLSELISQPLAMEERPL